MVDWAGAVIACVGMAGIAVSLALLLLSRRLKGRAPKPALVLFTAVLAIASVSIVGFYVAGRLG